MQPIRLTEQLPVDVAGLCVEADGRLVRNVALAGMLSRNGYQYTAEALRSAASLYHEKPVFLDHSSDRNRPAERSTRDLVGAIENPRFEDGRIRGDIRVVDTETGRLFLGLVEARTPGVGMSHVVLAERSRNGKQVERIVDVISVDVVVSPATTSTFAESLREEESLPLLEAADPRLHQLEVERTALSERVQQLEAQLSARRREGEVEQLIRESGLPTPAVTRCFRNQLLAAESFESCRELLEDRLALLAIAARPGSQVAMSAERARVDEHLADDEAFLRVLQRR